MGSVEVESGERGLWRWCTLGHERGETPFAARCLGSSGAGGVKGGRAAQSGPTWSAPRATKSHAKPRFPRFPLLISRCLSFFFFRGRSRLSPSTAIMQKLVRPYTVSRNSPSLTRALRSPQQNTSACNNIVRSYRSTAVSGPPALPRAALTPAVLHTTLRRPCPMPLLESRSEQRCFSSSTEKLRHAPLSHRAFVALGSNLGDRIAMIEQACNAMESKGDIRILRTSSLWETKAMYVEDQGNFVNGACEVSSILSNTFTSSFYFVYEIMVNW